MKMNIYKNAGLYKRRSPKKTKTSDDNTDSKSNAPNENIRKFIMRKNMTKYRTNRKWKAELSSRKWLILLGVSISLSILVRRSITSIALNFHYQNKHTNYKHLKPRIVYNMELGNDDNEETIREFSSFKSSIKKVYGRKVVTDQENDSKSDRKEVGEDEDQGDCSYQYSWQHDSYPTCNIVHETQLHNVIDKFLAHGYYRDVWKIPNDPLVIKTIRMERDFSHRMIDKQRIDAVAMERLSTSPNILHIYGYCGFSGIFPLSLQGDLEGSYKKLTKEERFNAAIDVASAIVDMHYCGENKILPAIAHADISAKQFLHVDDRYVLNDFNRARFLKWNSHQEEICSFQIKVNKGKNRSPEEYNRGNLTEKIDVYSMGNIFYRLLENKPNFEKTKKEKVYALVRGGKVPAVSQETKESKDPIIRALFHAMKMCFVHDSSNRPSSKEILKFLLHVKENIHSKNI